MNWGFGMEMFEILYFKRQVYKWKQSFNTPLEMEFLVYTVCSYQLTCLYCNTQVRSKKMEKDISANINLKKAGVVILLSGKLNFRGKKILPEAKNEVQ